VCSQSAEKLVEQEQGERVSEPAESLQQHIRKPCTPSSDRIIDLFTASAR
jgi:hypothetical protein